MSSQNFHRPVQLRVSDDEVSEDYDSAQDQVGSSEDDTGSESGDSKSEIRSEDGSQSDANEDEDEQEKLKDISFGALAKAQEAFAAPSRSKKRKLSEVQDEVDVNIKDSTQPTRQQKHPLSKPNQPIHRSSKHAPTILSSKHPVSRKRTVFDAPESLKSRDPRFDATIKSSTRTPQAISHADQNYAFLSTYQATEVLELKATLKKTKDPTASAALKRQIMSLESKLRNAEVRQKERDIQRQHRDTERQAIRQGTKSRPFFLKQSDVRKQIERERVEGLGKKARDKMEKRKVKKQKGKDGRDLPRFRRSVDG